MSDPGRESKGGGGGGATLEFLTLMSRWRILEFVEGRGGGKLETTW